MKTLRSLAELVLFSALPFCIYATDAAESYKVSLGRGYTTLGDNLYPGKNTRICSFDVTVQNLGETDHFPRTSTIIELCTDGSSETVAVLGPTTVVVDVGPNGETTQVADGLDRAITHIVQLDLNGLSSLGPTQARLNPRIPSEGCITEQANLTPGILDVPPFTASGSADSCFDLYVEIVAQTPNGPFVLRNTQPKRMCSMISHKPPGPGTVYESPNKVPLCLADGTASGYSLCATRHWPNPPVEIDRFDHTLGDLTLMMPDGSSQTVTVSGPTTVAVYFEGTEQGDAMDNDGDGRDEVRTELIELSLGGLSPTLGPVRVGLNTTLQSLGEMEETANNTPGRMDLPPFTAGGTAESFFDVFLEIEVAGQTFYTRQPKHMAGVISHKPPAPGDLYGGVEPVELYDKLGRPTGILLTVAHHIPNPGCPRLTISLVQVAGAAGTCEVEVCWQETGRHCALQFTRELGATVSWQDWAGPIQTRPDGSKCVVIAQPQRTMFFRLCGSCP